jgi:hypothetical protein
MEYPNDRPTYNRIKKLFSDERSHLSGKAIVVNSRHMKRPDDSRTANNDYALCDTHLTKGGSAT